jgi:hypothetical protein
LATVAIYPQWQTGNVLRASPHRFARLGINQFPGSNSNDSNL